MARNAIKVLKDKGNTTHLLIKGTNTPTINAIRRTILSEVPVLAIEELAMYENNSVLFDEFLGHRLGMVPLTTDSKNYKLGDKIKFSLDVGGPGTVYSKDITLADTGIKVIDERIPLAKLKAGQRIRMEGEAVMGQGKDHVKYQPAVAGYRAMPVFTISENIPAEAMQRIADSCPVKIIEIKGKKLNITEPGDCTLCGNCEEVGGSAHIQVDADDSSFILMLETHGGLSNKDILHQACDILIEKTKGFASQLEEGL